MLFTGYYYPKYNHCNLELLTDKIKNNLTVKVSLYKGEDGS